MAIKNFFRKSKKKVAKTKKDLSISDGGVIKIDTGKLNLPTQLMEEQGEIDKPFWHIEPVIIIIFSLAIAFIIFITILISRMPLPTK